MSESNQNGSLGAKPSLNGLVTLLSTRKALVRIYKLKLSQNTAKDTMIIEFGLLFYTGENQGSVRYQQDLVVEGSTAVGISALPLFLASFFSSSH